MRIPPFSVLSLFYSNDVLPIFLRADGARVPFPAAAAAAAPV